MGSGPESDLASPPALSSVLCLSVCDLQDKVWPRATLQSHLAPFRLGALSLIRRGQVLRAGLGACDL